MLLQELTEALEELPDPSYVEGTAELNEKFTITLPDGNFRTLKDKDFVEWLISHAEDAPYGEGGETKRNKRVRNALRLIARGEVRIAGFRPADVLSDIEAAISPRAHLEAELVDVIIYKKGGKFERHKDTPRADNLVGTLVVGLPIEHTGGAFKIIDGGKCHAIDWSEKNNPGIVRWVALFSDVDHAVAEVKSGTRITLVYALSRSERSRNDVVRDKRLDRLRAAVANLAIFEGIPLLIPCTRQIISDGIQPQPIEMLRGTDREIADVFLEAGFDVAVRACLVGDETKRSDAAFTPNFWNVTRLAEAIPANTFAEMKKCGVVSMTDGAGFDDDGGDDADPEYDDTDPEYFKVDNLDNSEDGRAGSSEVGEKAGNVVLLGTYALDVAGSDHIVVRKRAAATAIYEGLYSETGYFGNEALVGRLYTLAAIEVSLRKAKPKLTATLPKPLAKGKARRR
jgi:hypothetical protein